VNVNAQQQGLESQPRTAIGSLSRRGGPSRIVERGMSDYSCCCFSRDPRAPQLKRAQRGSQKLPSTTPASIRAAVYCRVSSEEQVHGTSLDDQAARGDSEANRRGYGRITVFRDEGVTGTTSDRPAWNRLIEAARNGQVDVVIATKWDRVARSARVGLQIVDELERLGVSLIIIDADFDASTPTGRMIRHMMVGFAALERDTIVERMARGQHAMAERGGWPSGGASPYGYRVVGGRRDNTLSVHEAEANTLRNVVRWVVEEGLTTGEAARRLNASGHLTRHGRLWSHQNLRRILTQRVLVGEIIWANTAKTHRSYVPSGKYGGPVTLHFEPIIDEELFARLQTILALRAHGPNTRAKPYPLSGRLMCYCGEPFGGVWRSDRDLRQYRCRAARWTATGEERCRSRRIDAKWIEGVVWQEVVRLLAQPERLLQCVNDYLGIRSSQLVVERDETDSIAGNISRLERALHRARMEALLDDDPGAYTALISEIKKELDGAKIQSELLRTWREESARESTRIRTIWEMAEAAAERLPAMSIAEKAELLSILDVRVTVLDPPLDVPARGGRNGGYGPARPRLRIEGSVPHQQLLNVLAPGDLTVAGTPLASLRPR
jgi:site-specific DNA recombinase